MRKKIPINFNWYYAPQFKDYYIHEIVNNEVQNVQLPHNNVELPYHYFSEEDFQFVSCYQKRLDIDENHKGKQILLHFEGVMNYSEVYLNGQYLCSHKGGYTPFTVDLTEHLFYEQSNLLVVKVDSRERDDIPPFGNVVDYLTYGGIYREVNLEVLDFTHIEDVFIKTKNVLSKTKSLEVHCTISQAIKVDDYIELEIPEINQKNKYNITKNKEIINQEVEDVKLWDIENPNLYHLTLRLFRKNKLIDEVTRRFGFREVKFKSDGFYLNDQRIKLRGLNRHQAYPYVGYAMPKRTQHEDALLLKEQCGVNIVRTSHYPQSTHFLDKCDELGLLVFSEIPGWQHIGGDNWKKVALQNVKEMITRDFNHPSIIIWGVRINESRDDDDFYKLTNELARKLDDTRPTGGVRNFSNSHLFEDVYTYNDFTYYGTNKGLSKRKKIINKDVPYLVTEHNGHMFPTKKFDFEHRRTEQALRHLTVLDEMYKQKDISGAIGWCMTDYNTHKDFGSGDRICYHGVMDMFRIPKTASYAYLSQQDEKSVMHVSSDMNIGEYDASKLSAVYVFTNCDYIKLYKNSTYITTFYPDKNQFKHLPHPPILIDDFFGDALYKNERFSKKDAKRIKEIFRLMLKHDKLPLRALLKMGYVMLKNKIRYQDAADLYTKYVANWGQKSIIYHFKGYRDNQLVCESIKGPSHRKDLYVLSSTHELIEDDTYDVARIEIKAVDEHENVLAYSNDIVKVECIGPLEVIGPEEFSLIGGTRSFWVKTRGKSGKGQIIIRSPHYKDKAIHIKIKKREC